MKIAAHGADYQREAYSYWESYCYASQIGRDFLKAWSEMERVQASVWAFGHSHQARMWRKASVSTSAQQLDAFEATSIEVGYRYFVNVGTTGLPFPGKGGPSVVLLDAARNQIRHLALDLHRIGSE